MLRMPIFSQQSDVIWKKVKIFLIIREEGHKAHVREKQCMSYLPSVKRVHTRAYHSQATMDRVCNTWTL